MLAPPVAKTKAKTTSATVPTQARKTGDHIPGRRDNSLAERVYLLQRTIGNQATQRLLVQRPSRLTWKELRDQHEPLTDPAVDWVRGETTFATRPFSGASQRPATTDVPAAKGPASAAIPALVSAR